MSPARPTLTVIGRRLDPEHHRLRDFLTRAAQPYDWVEADGAATDLPVVIDGGVRITGATVERLLEAWGDSNEPREERYDIAIVGAGPAGLAAAVYAATDGLSTLLLEDDLPGGQASHTSMIENFFGFPEGIGGAQLCRRAGRQAQRFGTDLLIGNGATGHMRDGDRFRLTLGSGTQVEAGVVIASPGMLWRRLDVDGVEALLGRGVYYGAGRSEALHCGDDDVVVVGAGNSAGQAVMDLAGAGARVQMLVRGGDLRKSMSEYLVRRIEAHPQISVHFGTQIEAVHASGEALAAVTVSGGVRLPARALFLCIGGRPRTGWAEGSGVCTDPRGFILTGHDVPRDHWPRERDPLPLETSVPGLFAAGDVRSGSTKRVGSAVGEGAMAVALAHQRLSEL